MKSILIVVRFFTLYPRFLTRVNAFRKTSGRSTAEPILIYTPPSRFATTPAKNLKSLWLPSPVALPSICGWIWIISVPIATWTVTGILSRAPAARMLKSLYANFDLFIISQLTYRYPSLFLHPFLLRCSTTLRFLLPCRTHPCQSLHLHPRLSFLHRQSQSHGQYMRRSWQLH